MEEGLTKEEIKGIEKGLEDIKKGRVYSIESLVEELGIELK